MSVWEFDSSRVVRAVKARMGEMVCPLCQHQEWSIAQAFVMLILQRQLPGIQIAGEALPLIAFTCTHCGNTHLLNANILGLSDLVPKPSSSASPSAEEPE